MLTTSRPLHTLLVLGALICAPACDGEDSIDTEERLAGPGGLPGSPCPNLVPPAPDFCPDGDVEVVKNNIGCVVGFECVATDCAEVPPPPASTCTAGTWVADVDAAGCALSFACNADQEYGDELRIAEPDAAPSQAGCPFGQCNPCPQVSPPAPGFCPGGTIVANTNPLGCVTGFSCT